MAVGYTEKSIRVPDVGTLNWGDDTNDNWEILSAILLNIIEGHGVFSGCVASDGGVLQLDYTSGSVNVAGTTHAITGSFKTATALATASTVQRNFLYVDNAGAVQISITLPTGNFALLAIADTDATNIIAVYDVRFLLDVNNKLNLTGGQIQFPSTAVPSTDTNTLDDYEEGTWTPVLEFGGASVGLTYTRQIGTYTKIGNLLTATCYVVLSAKGSSVGEAEITGLPFTSLNLANMNWPATIRPKRLSFTDIPAAFVAANTSVIGLDEITTAGTQTPLEDTNFADNSTMMVTAVYQV